MVQGPGPIARSRHRRAAADRGAGPARAGHAARHQGGARRLLPPSRSRARHGRLLQDAGEEARHGAQHAQSVPARRAHRAGGALAARHGGEPGAGSFAAEAGGPRVSPRILVFDSGMGGLTVATAIRAALPEAELVYAADSAAFPYGAWPEAPLVERIATVVARLIDEIAPDAVVIACNTASTLALAELRRRHTLPFIGTVPAIKPAAAQTKSRIIGVLATRGTVTREYTQALIHTYAYHCRVILHGATHLAGMGDARLSGAPPRPAAS